MTTKINGVLQDVQWRVEDCDMLVEVEHTLCPVQCHFVAMLSEFFRHIADMMQQKHVTAVLGGFEGAEIETVLKRIYNTNGTEITDSNWHLCSNYEVLEVFEQTAEFASLDKSTKNLVLRYALKRYKQAKSAIYDVYTCAPVTVGTVRGFGP